MKYQRACAAHAMRVLALGLYEWANDGGGQEVVGLCTVRIYENATQAQPPPYPEPLTKNSKPVEVA